VVACALIFVFASHCNIDGLPGVANTWYKVIISQRGYLAIRLMACAFGNLVLSSDGYFILIVVSLHCAVMKLLEPLFLVPLGPKILDPHPPGTKSMDPLKYFIPLQNLLFAHIQRGPNFSPERSIPLSC